MTDCPTCKGRGLVRLHWKAKRGFCRLYRDEWCRRCDGKGVIKHAEKG